MPLPPRAIAALCAVADRLAAARVEWVLTGSAGRALAGHAARPRDIDLEVAEADAGRAAAAMGAGAPARESGAGRTSLRVHATLAGMEVDVSAGLAVEGPGGRLEAAFGLQREWARHVVVAGRPVALAPVEESLARALVLGDWPALAKIAALRRRRPGGARAARGLRVGAPGLGGRERRAIGAVPPGHPEGGGEVGGAGGAEPGVEHQGDGRGQPLLALLGRGGRHRGQHDHDLALRRSGDSLGQLGERAAQHLLVELGQLPAHGRLALRPGLGQLGQQRGQPVGALEEDRGHLERGEPLHEGPALAGRPRDEPVNSKPPPPASPETASAEVTALGPGTTVTAIPASMAARTSRAPGSLTRGMPASLTRATVPPARIRATSSAARAASLCACSATIGVVAPAWRISTAVRRVSSHATTSASRRHAAARGARSSRFPIGVPTTTRPPARVTAAPPRPRRSSPRGTLPSAPMPRTTKPYRRYRARGGEGEDRDGLDELRAMTARASGVASPPGAPPGRGRAGAPAPPPPAPKPGRLERDQRRALKREGRRWWSLRGLGPGGWIGRIAIVLLLGVFVWGAARLHGAQQRRRASRTTRSPRPRAAALDEPPGGMLGTPTRTR